MVGIYYMKLLLGMAPTATASHTSKNCADQRKRIDKQNVVHIHEPDFGSGVRSGRRLSIDHASVGGA